MIRASSIVLALLAASCSGAPPPKEALQAADQAFQAHTFAAAETLYRTLLESAPPPAPPAFLHLRLGRCLQARKAYAEARIAFEKALADPAAPGVDMNSLLEYGDVQPSAQWGIAECFEAEGRWQEARDAYIRSRDRYPRRSWCGNCNSSLPQATLIAIGRCTAALDRNR